MKRMNNLYENICEFSNIEHAFNEVCRNTKNKRKVENLKEYKSIYISRIYKNTNNFIFLGKNNVGNYSRYRNVKRKLKCKTYLYNNNKVSLQSISSSIICYKGLCNKSFLTYY